MESERFFGPVPRRRASPVLTASEAAPLRALPRAAVGVRRRGARFRDPVRLPPGGLVGTRTATAPQPTGEQSHRRLRLEPIEGGSEVVVLGLQPVEPVPEGSHEVRLRSLRQPQQMVGVAPPEFVPVPDSSSLSTAYSRIVSSIANLRSFVRFLRSGSTRCRSGTRARLPRRGRPRTRAPRLRACSRLRTPRAA